MAGSSSAFGIDLQRKKSALPEDRTVYQNVDEKAERYFTQEMTTLSVALPRICPPQRQNGKTRTSMKGKTGFYSRKKTAPFKA